MYVAKPLPFPISDFLAYITTNYPFVLTDYDFKKLEAVFPRHTRLKPKELAFVLLKQELFEPLKANI